MLLFVFFTSFYNGLICSYVLKYISKSESTGVDMSLRAVGDDKSLWKVVHKLAMACLKQRQEGVYEAIDDLMGRPIVQKSRTVGHSQ